MCEDDVDLGRRREREMEGGERKRTSARRTDEDHSELLSRSKVLDGSLDFGFSRRLESGDLLGQLESERKGREEGRSARACEKEEKVETYLGDEGLEVFEFRGHDARREGEERRGR